MAVTQEFVVAKFGGTSLASAERFMQAAAIIRSDPRRKVIVVSAPGARYTGDIKITDLLFEWAKDEASAGDPILHQIRERLQTISTGVSFSTDLAQQFEQIHQHVSKLAKLTTTRRSHMIDQFVASRGEWFSAQMLAQMLGYDFIDAAEFIAFEKRGHYSHEATRKNAARIDLMTRAARGVVIPGYYGAEPDGTIRTFTRGGSDLTGAITAVLVGAIEYENWTDVTGVFTSDPRIVQGALPNRVVTFRELRELSYSGATVIHADAAKVAFEHHIPVRIRSSFEPGDPGTLVVPSYDTNPPRRVTGIAGKKGFVAITLERLGLDDACGTLTGMAKVFSDLHISVNAYPDIDALTFTLPESDYVRHDRTIRMQLEGAFKVDLTVRRDIALLCVVGEGMVDAIGTTAIIDKALADAGINVLIQSQSVRQTNVTRGFAADRLEDGIRAVHAAFFH